MPTIGAPPTAVSVPHKDHRVVRTFSEKAVSTVTGLSSGKVAMAVEKRLLTDVRPRCAREVAKAGNKAVHDPEMFHRDYSAEKVQEVLISTRKVLEELYRLPSA